MDPQIECLFSTGMNAMEIAEQLGVPLPYVEESIIRQGLND
jgi:hypothetical protein